MAPPPPGHVLFVLHTHLPWVLGHGRWPHGQDWLNEAAAECYVHLVRMLDRLVADGISPRIAIGVTPVLMEQLASRTFRDDFLAYVDGRAELARRDREEFRSMGAYEAAGLADMWASFYGDVRRHFEAFDADLLAQLRRLQRDGHVEVLTSAATHGYLPLLGTDASIDAQVRLGIATYRRHFRRPPRGMWLPECAYRPAGSWSRPTGGKAWKRPGIEDVIARHGLKYFVVDTHLVAGGVPLGTYEDRFPERPEVAAKPARSASPNDPHVVVAKSRRRVAVLARDPRSSTQVWSADYGYPGDGVYLEFHKRKGEGGLRYARVTSRETSLDAKETYHPEPAGRRAATHAEHFATLVRETLERHRTETGRPGVVVAPFDTELFGHWWFEGPRWLEAVIRNLQDGVTTITPSKLLEKHPPKSVIRLPEGSWGLGGGHYVWWNDDTRWVWERVYAAEDAFREVAKAARRKRRPQLKRVMRQLARELLLLESSDWPFLITTVSARDYAEGRVTLHGETFDRLLRLAKVAMDGPLAVDDAAWLTQVEARDVPFPTVDPSWWLRA